MSTWLDFCVRRDGPPNKVGYGSLRETPLSEKEGETKHSMEGRISGALAVLDNPNIQSSWTFSLPNDGPPLQHYPLEVITWHAGVQGDRRTDTSLVGNLTLIGEEHEDWPDNKLTPNQIHWTTELSKVVRRLCPLGPPELRVNLWEHNWLSATSCPSGLIPWPEIIASLEDNVNQAEFNKMFKVAWENEKMTRDDRTSGSQELIPYATPARIAQATQSHGKSPHGGTMPKHKHPLTATLSGETGEA